MTDEEKKIQMDAEKEKQSLLDAEKLKEDFKPNQSAEEYAAKWRAASGEAKKERQEKAKYKAELEEIKNKDLESQGKYKEMYETAQGKLTHLHGAAVNGAKKAYLKDKLSEMGLHASAADRVLRLADLKSIEVDQDTFKPDMEQIAFEANKLKEELPMLFGKKYVAPKDGTPSGGAAPEKKSVKDMDDKQLDTLYSQALSEL